MAITFHPNAGTILLCDFSQGFKEPEMVKSKRPVLVVTPPLVGRSNLVTILALSTVKPDPIQDYHYLLPKKALPQLGNFQTKETWIKADMIYTVGFHPLDLIRLNKRDVNGKRQYFRNRLSREKMSDIYKCMLHGLHLGFLGEHL